MVQRTDKWKAVIRKTGMIVLALCISAAFSSCYIKFKTPHEKELDSFVRYVIQNASVENLKADRAGVDERMRQVSITFGEVTSLEQTDNIAFAVDKYLGEKPDSFFNKEGYNLSIVTEKREVKRKNPPLSYLQYYAELKSRRIDERTTRIDCIEVLHSSSFPVTDFLKCKVKYKSIVFSQDVDFYELEELAKADDLNRVCLREFDAGSVSQTKSADLEYESYIRYCEIAERINAEKGFRLADVSLLNATKEKWQKEYGRKFAEIGAIPRSDFKLTLNEDYSITRDSHDEYYGDNYSLLTWRIICDGEIVLERIAMGELVLLPHFQWHTKNTGTFNVYLIAVVDGKYTRVSNIIEYTITEPPVTPAGAALFMRVNGKSVPVVWEDNKTVEELKVLSYKEGMTVKLTKRTENMQRGLIERVIDNNDANIDVTTGDIVLYMGNWLGVCLGPGNGKYTKLGKIDLPENELKELFSKDEVTLTLIWGVP